jgi:four helix bundle protein
VNAEGGTRSTPGACMTGDVIARANVVAVHAIGLLESVPRGRTAEVVGRHRLRSDTSVMATWGGARRARSRSEVIARMGIVEEEADERAFWLELLEASPLTAIPVASIRTAGASRQDVPRSGFRVRGSP